MIPITRIGDISVGICSIGAECCPHVWVSVHITGSPEDHSDSRNNLRIGDLGACSCPHCPISFAVTGSNVTHDNGIPVHRLGDVHNVACGSGVVVTASEINHSI